MHCICCNELLPTLYSKKSNNDDEDLCPTCLNESKLLLLDFDEEQLFQLPEDDFISYE